LHVCGKTCSNASATNQQPSSGCTNGEHAGLLLLLYTWRVRCASHRARNKHHPMCRYLHAMRHLTKHALGSHAMLLLVLRHQSSTSPASMQHH
jgi:hypothetical protein